MDLNKYKEIFHEFAGDAEFINKQIKKLNFDTTSKLLDVGTGMGAMSILLALNGFKVLTGEPEKEIKGDEEFNHEYPHYTSAPPPKDICSNQDNHNWEEWGDWERSAKVLGVEHLITYQHFDVQALPFEDHSFHGIFLYDSLQHIQNRELALKECLRVLKDRGKIIVIEWTEKKIEEDYKKYGFKIDKIDPRDYIDRRLTSIEIVSGDLVNFNIIRKK